MSAVDGPKDGTHGEGRDLPVSARLWLVLSSDKRWACRLATCPAPSLGGADAGSRRDDRSGRGVWKASASLLVEATEMILSLSFSILTYSATILGIESKTG